MEAVEVGKAVSLVLLGEIAAVFLGPELAKKTRALLPFGLYSGSFASLTAGTVIFLGGWEVVNVLSLPFLIAVLGVIWKLRHRIDE